MKRFFTFILIIAFSFSLFSCTQEAKNENSSNSKSENSAKEPEFVMSDDVVKIQQYLGGDIDRTMLAKNLFLGKTYTFSRKTNDTYTDNGGHKLTDGATVQVFDTYSFVAWDGHKGASIDFDLGEGNHSIGDITVGCLRVMDYGIGLPKSVAVLVSDDGENYTELARVYKPSDIDLAAKYDYVFAFPKSVNARYVRVFCDNPDNAFLFIDEISAYEYCEDGTIDRSINASNEQIYTINDFYDYNLNTGESSVKVSESDPDYNDEINLAALDGVDFQIEHFDPLAANHSNSPKNLISRITDGVAHGKFNEEYFVFYRGTGRHVVADLGHIMSVSKTNIMFFDKYTYGISTPVVYYLSLSENGENWTTVYGEFNENYGIKELEHDTKSIDFGEEYRARYVRLTFPTVPDNSVSCSVYLGEWEIIGKKNAANAVAAKEYDANRYGRYPSTEEFGIDNILFAPITDGYGNHCTTKHLMSEEAAYIYLSSFDENGKANGIFYDSIAFSTRGELNNHTDRTEGMSFFFDELFYEGINLDAVQNAKARLNSELGENEKIKIWISVNSPAIGDTFNGKAVSTLEDFNACLKWQADEAIRRFNEKGYKNLELVGFYWQHELIRPDTFDEDAMTAFNEYIHSIGYLTLWCPYYNASGIWMNHKVGFDISCLQPNYMFYDTEPTRMRTTAELARLYGMCVEIEIESGTQSKEAVALYREYLSAGYKYGFMNSIKVYYQGGLPGAYYYAHSAEDDLTKSVYNDTILYAKELLDESYVADATSSIEGFKNCTITVKNGMNATVDLGEIGNITYRIVRSPLYGGVRIDFDGTLAYYAMKGYKGEDEIWIEFFDGVSETKEIVIKITVTE